jgi:beta-glucosidase
VKPLALLTLCLIPIFAFSQTTPPAYLDPSLPIDVRVNDLVSRLTTDEKISQMQDVAPAIPRLNIPAYNWWNEGLHGVANSGTATVFPQAIGLAATWDTDLLHRVADTISTEARAKYNDAQLHNNTHRFFGLTFWSPNINIFRDPRWGRGQETYGEDPFLTARLGVAFVAGLQGDDPNYLKTVSTPKHYAVHSGPELLRHRFDVPVSLHDLYDTYTPAFRATVVDGRADSIMCAYNSVRGEPACANRLLFNLLRNQWGFRGYVVSDCWAVNDLYQGHNFVLSLDQAAALSLKAGTDLSCGPQFKILDHALEDRLVSTEDIDRAVKRLFEARFRLGMFDPPDRVPWSKLTLADVDTPANRQLALDAAHESIVLLKNERNTLPLNPKIKSIAVVGPTADSLPALLGNYNGMPSAYTTILAGIRKKFPNAKINYAPGAPLTESRALPVPSSALRTSATPSANLGGRSFSSDIRDTKQTGLQPLRTRLSSPTAAALSANSPGSVGFLSLSSPLPPSSPLPQSSPAWTPGLHAEYFANTTLSGSPAFERIDPDINFDWNLAPPAPGLPSENYSVRWSGALVPPVDGDYRLGTFCGGGCRLYLDGQLLVDDWTPHGERTITYLVHLQAAHAYPIKFECFHLRWQSTARLVWLPPHLLEDAVAAARKSDVIIAVVGITAELESEEGDNDDPGFFGGDRTDITLPAPQEQLLEALATADKPLIVVLTSGSALAVNWANEHAAAILEAWYPGEEGGTAVADVLSGDYNPSGRLPITFYRSVAQLPPFTVYSMANRTYRYFTEEPLFPFGYGLSYSTFSFSDTVAKPAPAAQTDCCTAHQTPPPRGGSLDPSEPVAQGASSSPAVVSSPLGSPLAVSKGRFWVFSGVSSPVTAPGVGASAPTLTAPTNRALAPEELHSPQQAGAAVTSGVFPCGTAIPGCALLPVVFKVPEARHPLPAAQNPKPIFPGNSPILVSTRVTNISSIAGDDIVQLYISHPNVEGAPIRALAGFQRIHLAPNASQIVNFTLTPRELSIVDPNGNRLVPAGPVVLWIGSGQPLPIFRQHGLTGVALKFNLASDTPLPN